MATMVCIASGLAWLPFAASVAIAAVLVAVILSMRKFFALYGEEAEEPAAPEQSAEPEPAANVATLAPENGAQDAEAAATLAVTAVADGQTQTYYDRTYLARLIQSDEEVKARYSRMKNALLAYAGVRARVSRKKETFRLGRATVAAFRFKGKTLCLYFAVPAEYGEGKYRLEPVKGAAGKDTPSMIRLKNETRAKRAAALIDSMLAERNAQKQEREQSNYAPPYENDETLLSKGLIKPKTGSFRPTPAKRA